MYFLYIVFNLYDLALKLIVTVYICWCFLFLSVNETRFLTWDCFASIAVTIETNLSHYSHSTWQLSVVTDYLPNSERNRTNLLNIRIDEWISEWLNDWLTTTRFAIWFVWLVVVVVWCCSFAHMLRNCYYSWGLSIICFTALNWASKLFSDNAIGWSHARRNKYWLLIS